MGGSSHSVVPVAHARCYDAARSAPLPDRGARGRARKDERALAAVLTQPRRQSPIQRLLRVGIEPSLGTEVQRQIAITNLFSTFIALTTLPWTFVFVAFGRRELAAAVFVVSAATAVSLLWNAQRKFIAARLWLLAWSN